MVLHGFGKVLNGIEVGARWLESRLRAPVLWRLPFPGTLRPTSLPFPETLTPTSLVFPQSPPNPIFGTLGSPIFGTSNAWREASRCARMQLPK